MSDNSAIGPNRTLEILRRLCLIVGAVMTVWAILKPCDALFRVRAVDFARHQKADARRMRSDIGMMNRISGADLDPNDPIANAAATLQLEPYIAKQTKGRLIEASGSQWSRFYDEVQQTLDGKSQAFIRRVNVGDGDYMLYFNTDMAPLNELAGKLDDKNNFTYVLLHEGGKDRYIEVLFQRPQSAFRDAPTWLLYPLRKHAVWFIILGLLAYAALPWHQKNADELRYSAARAIVAPDVLGALMAAFFFALPILVITTNASPSEHPDMFGFSNGWWPVTAVSWLLAILGLCINLVALWYSCFTLQIADCGFRIQTLFLNEMCDFADIEKITPAHWGWPSWLRALAVIVGFLNWRALGPILIGSYEEAYGVTLHLKSGRKTTIWMSSLPGFQRIFHALRRHNVLLEPDLAAMIDEDLTIAMPAPKSGTGRKIAAIIMMALAISGAWIWQYWPEKTRVIKHELQFSYEQLAQRRLLLNEMQKISTAMGPAAAQQGSSGLQQFEQLQKQYEEIEKRYNAIQPAEEE